MNEKEIKKRMKQIKSDTNKLEKDYAVARKELANRERQLLDMIQREAAPRKRELRDDEVAEYFGRIGYNMTDTKNGVTLWHTKHPIMSIKQARAIMKLQGGTDAQE